MVISIITMATFTPEAAAAAAEANAQQINMLCDNLSKTILNVKRNDLTTLIGIPIYEGRSLEGRPSPYGVHSRTDAGTTNDLDDWLLIIEQKTRKGFDDIGKIQAAEKFSAGTGLRSVESVVHALGENLNWGAFKKRLVELVGQPIDTRKYRKILHSATAKKKTRPCLIFTLE